MRIKQSRKTISFRKEAGVAWACTLFDVSLDLCPHCLCFLENPAQPWPALHSGNQTLEQRWNNKKPGHIGPWFPLLRILANNFQKLLCKNIPLIIYLHRPFPPYHKKSRITLISPFSSKVAVHIFSFSLGNRLISQLFCFRLYRNHSTPVLFSGKC